MKSIYKIAAVGILLVAAIAFISAKVFSASAAEEPVVIETSVSVIEDFYAETIKDATITDEKASYSGERWLASDGTVSHPQWFEGDKLILADGVYYLIKAYPAPDYYLNGSGEFADMIDIGNPQSENGNSFESVNASEPLEREVAGNVYTYRELAKNGAMVLNLKCSPDSVNYLTVRLWGGDTGDTMLWVCDPASGNMNETDSEQPQRNSGVADRRDWTELNTVSAVPQYEGGFVYATYKIPQIYTSGKSSVSLRLYSTGGPADYGSVAIKDQTQMSRGIYDVYMTQEAAFEPSDYGREDREYTEAPEALYDIYDTAAMEKQKDSLKEAILSGIDVLRQWQIYSDEAPSYMQGMITRADWRANMPQSDEEWKNRYYNSSFMLKQNMTPLNMLALASYAYDNAAELGLSDEERDEMLGRAVAGIDFLCRAQGENGGFFSEAWIGGPSRGNASGNNLTGFGLRYAGQCALDILGVLDQAALEELIDSDADGEADLSRAQAWTVMLEKARDYLLDINGGFGHAPNQDMANSEAALLFDRAVGILGGKTLSKSGAGAVFDRCFGLAKNPLTSGYWVSPKGTILENFGSVQGGYSGDYGSNAVVQMSRIARTAKIYYGYDYGAYMETVYDTIDKYYFTGIGFENGGSCAREYTEGIISNRNVYYAGTERYPIDIYGALELENDTALKIIANYLTHNDIELMMRGGNELNVSNAHFEDNMLDAVYLYKYFDEITEAARERNIGDYDFLMEDGGVYSYAWADEMARNVCIKDGDEKIYMALNWRNPAHSQKMYAPGEQEIRANNLCRVHAVNSVYDRYGYAAMTTDGYEEWTAAAGTDGCMEALMTVQYGKYSVIMNSYNCSGSGSAMDFKAEAFEENAGLDRNKTYMDMMTGDIYSYSGGYWHSKGSIMQSRSNSTLVLKALETDISASRPFIEGGIASAVVTNITDGDTEVVLYAAEYDESGALAEAASKTALAEPGITKIEIDAPNAQRAFIWDGNMKPLN